MGGKPTLNGAEEEVWRTRAPSSQSRVPYHMKRLLDEVLESAELEQSILLGEHLFRTLFGNVLVIVSEQMKQSVDEKARDLLPQRNPFAVRLTGGGIH